jgi:hypothetical protein
VLWFERSNSYVVISKTAYQLLNCFFDSKDKIAFTQHLEKHFDVSKMQAHAYYTDFLGFLNDTKLDTELLENFEIQVSIPDPEIANYYLFGDTSIAINYSSTKLLQLIHPYLQHATAMESANVDAVFDIFVDKGQIYLFKKKVFVGRYETANFHFLQGKFAMELVASIYKNTESDWLATFHASTVCNEKEAIMIIGDSGNGKSTLSALLMAHGFDLLADDFTPMLAKNQHLYRFPAAISIKQGAFSMIEDLYENFNGAELQVSSSKHSTVKYLPPSKSFKSSQKHFECNKIVMVKYSRDSKSQLRKCSSEKILQTLIPDSWISPQTEHSKQFLNWLKKLKFYELVYSDNEFAINKFKELFE